MTKTTLIDLREYKRNLVQPHPCPNDGVDDVFLKICVYIFDYLQLFQVRKYWWQ